MNLWAVGSITGSFGIRGFVKTKPLSDSSARFKKLRQVYRGLKPDAVVADDVEKVEIREGYVLLKFRSIRDKNGADALKGQYVFVDDADVVSPRPGRYFTHDIIGCRVETAGGTQIGVVKDIYKSAAHDIWIIETGKKSFMIPAVRDFILAVDLEDKSVTVKVIEGLMDLQV